MPDLLSNKFCMSYASSCPVLQHISLYGLLIPRPPRYSYTKSAMNTLFMKVIYKVSQWHSWDSNFKIIRFKTLTYSVHSTIKSLAASRLQQKMRCGYFWKFTQNYVKLHTYYHNWKWKASRPSFIKTKITCRCTLYTVYTLWYYNFLTNCSGAFITEITIN